MRTLPTSAALDVAPLCPDCGASMNRKLVRKGRRAGLEIWSCARFPECHGLINIDPPAVEQQPRAVADSYAQRRLQKELERDRLKRRAALPLFIGASVLIVTVVWYAAQPFGVVVASISAVVAGGVLGWTIIRLPFDSLVWARGVEGEQKTREFLEPVLDAGCVVLYNRLIPGVGGDVDSIVIGPTGVFSIETKNWSGKLDVRNERFFVGTHDRTWALEQLYREALAVQIALGEELNVQRATVTPVLCAIGGLTASDRIVAGAYVTNGKRLAHFIIDRPRLFDDEVVHRLARLADRRLRQQYAWEV